MTVVITTESPVSRTDTPGGGGYQADVFVDLFNEPVCALCTQVADGLAHIQVDQSSIVTIQIPFPQSGRKSVDQTSDDGLILGQFPAIGLFYEICDARVSGYLISGILQIDA